MTTSGPERPVAELAERLRSLSVTDQLQVLRAALRGNPDAPDDSFRAAAERVLREDRDILESLPD